MNTKEKMMRAKNFTQILFSLAILLTGFSANAGTVTSLGDGDFSDPGTWDSGELPGINDSVVIATDNYVTVTEDDTVGSLTVYALNDADLTRILISPGVTLVVKNNLRIESDGASAYDEAVSQIRLPGTLVVEGDLEFKTASGADPGFAVLKMIYAGGTLILHGNLSFIGEGGTIDARNINETTVKMVGSSDQTLTVNSNIEYFNIIIDKSGGATVTLDGVLTSSNLYGDLTIENGIFDNGGNDIGGNDSTFTVKSGTKYILGGSTTLPTGLTHVIESGSTLEYQGSTQIGTPNNSQTYDALLISGSGTKTLGGNITVDGNITMTGGTLDANVTSNYNISVSGNWINTGATFEPRLGTVTFNGSSDQAITSNDKDFYNLVINNSATQVSLNDNVSVSGTCTLTDGVVTTGTDSLFVTNTDASSLTGFSSASFVNGNLVRNITTNTSTYSFPVGNGTGTSNYFLADIDNNNLTGTSYIVGNFGALQNHNDEEMVASDNWLNYNTINTAGTWKLEPNSQPSGGDYSVKLYISNFSGLTDNQFAPLKRPVGSTSGADWTDGNGTLNPNDGDGRLVANGYALRKGLSSFSEFGVGGGNPSGGGLPIELLDFTATVVNDIVYIRWTTATEINNDYFTVERSSDGEHFHKLGKLDGAGNSAQMLEYAVTDLNPLKGISYYRLKQTDFDGSYHYSEVVSVSIQEEVNGFDYDFKFDIYPNPVPHNGNLEVHVPDLEKTFRVDLFDLAGNNVYSGQGAKGEIIVPNNFPAGMYLLSLSSGNIQEYRKLVIN